ncbi:hypothetical protein ACOZ4N_13735 [Halorientalis pallida]|uniref:hypothetical protein n=1 Tax=Halorientalis pallida TaxID=2479928 RepID=UPI003C6F2439
MALQLPLALLGLAELLAPRKVVDFWMDLAVTDDSEVELRPWVYTAARIEGILILLWVVSRRGGDADD